MKNVLLLLSITLMQGCNPKLKPSNQNLVREDWWLWAAAWHPNKDQLVVGGTQDTLRLFSSRNYQLLTNYPFEGTITKTKWHPTKNILAVAMQGEKSKTSIFKLDQNERIELDSINDFGARAIAWNSQGTLLAVGDYDGLLSIFDETGKSIKRIVTNQRALVDVNWHPSKDIIIAVGDRISIYDLQADTLHHIEDRKEDVLMLCVEWHPSGELFVTGDYGDFEHNYPPLLQYWTPTGKNIRTIAESKAEFRNMNWSADGRLLATASESIRLWDKGGNLVSERISPHLLWGIDWNKDGSKLLTTDKTGSIVVWDRDLNKLYEVGY